MVENWRGVKTPSQCQKIAKIESWVCKFVSSVAKNYIFELFLDWKLFVLNFCEINSIWVVLWHERFLKKSNKLNGTFHNKTITFQIWGLLGITI